MIEKRNNFKEITGYDFTDFYNEKYNYVKHYLIQYFGKSLNRIDLAVAIDDSFLKLHKYIHNFDKSKSKLDTYFLTICRNEVLYKLKMTTYVKRIDTLNIVDIKANERYILGVYDTEYNEDMYDLMYKLIEDELTPRKRIILKMRIDNYSYQEIADFLEISKQSVKAHIFDAKAKLRKKVDK